MTTYIYKDELYHHGVKGQKWGIRRYQNEDGSYTEAGLKRRSSDAERHERRKVIARRVAIGAAIVGGTVLAIYGAKKLSECKNSPRLTNDLLKNLGIATFEPETFKPETFKPEGTEMIDRLKKQTETVHRANEVKSQIAKKALEEYNKPKEKSLSDFKFERRLMMKKDGLTDYQDVPVDKKGYAEVFARSMSKNSKKEKEDYEYWYDYIMKKIG